MNFAIIGATGNVGRKTIEVLEKSRLEIDNLFLVASEKSAGQKLIFKKKEIIVEQLEKYDFSKAEITIFAAGSEIAKNWVPSSAKKTIDHGSCFGINSSSELEVITSQDLRKHMPERNTEELTATLSACNLERDDAKSASEQLTALLSNTQLKKKLSENAPQIYKKYIFYRMTSIICSNPDLRNSKKSDWVLLTRFAEINGKKLPLSRYVTWMYRTFREDPVAHMQDWSTVSIQHQPDYLIDEMFESIVHIFKSIISWRPSEGLRELQNRSGLLQYQFAHAMPYLRGSAAISEWLEATLYQLHGYTLQRKAHESVNVHALAHPF